MSNTGNWASRQKDALKAVEVKTELKEVSTGGGNITFYNFNPSDRPNTKVLTKGDTIEGKYLGSPIGKTYGNPYHKIETTEGVIALPSAGQLNKMIANVAEGADIKIVYNGKEKMGSGKFAGKEAHTFKLFASAFKE
jgi:hypothetical protein